MAVDTGKLDAAWKASGGQGDRPAGWYGAGGSPDNPNYGGGNQSTGGGSFNYPSINLPSSVGYAQSLEQPIDAAFGKYLEKSSAQQTPLQMYSQFSGELGIPQLQRTSETLSGQIYDVEDAIRRVKRNIEQTSRESLVTQGMKDRLVNADRQPLLEQLEPLSTAYGRIQSSLQDRIGEAGRLTGYGMEGNKQALEPYKMQVDFMTDKAARLMTGFNADKETELRVLLDKIDKQFTLTRDEEARAAELSKMKLAYDLELEKNVAMPQTEVVTVGGRKKLINKQTGAVISDLGSSSDGSGSDSSWIAKFIEDWQKGQAGNKNRPPIESFEESGTGIPNDKDGDGFPDSNYDPFKRYT